MTARWSPSRRRFLSIAAAVAGLGLLRQSAAGREAAFETWRGTALGAHASIRLYHPDRAFARDLIRRARLEIDLRAQEHLDRHRHRDPEGDAHQRVRIV